MKKNLMIFCCLIITSGLSFNVSAQKQKVILDAAAGSDIDDIWAVAQLLRSPEMDVKPVLSSYLNTHYRARVLCNFLEASNRSDLPVGVGPYQAICRGDARLNWR